MIRLVVFIGASAFCVAFFAAFVAALVVSAVTR